MLWTLPCHLFTSAGKRLLLLSTCWSAPALTKASIGTTRWSRVSALRYSQRILAMSSRWIYSIYMQRLQHQTTNLTFFHSLPVAWPQGIRLWNRECEYSHFRSRLDLVFCKDIHVKLLFQNYTMWRFPLQKLEEHLAARRQLVEEGSLDQMHGNNTWEGFYFFCWIECYKQYSKSIILPFLLFNVSDAWRPFFMQIFFNLASFFVL